MAGWARARIARALELDPFNVTIHGFHAVGLVCDRRYEEATAAARTTLKMQPDNPVALSALVLALHQLKRHDEAIAAAVDAYATWLPDVGDALKRSYAELGYAGAWRRAAEPAAAEDVAMNFAFAGDCARALDWVERAYERRGPGLPYIACAPYFDPLCGEPRFRAVLAKMGLPLS